MKKILFILFLTLLYTQDYQFSDFVGTWDGNITNDQTWSYDDLIGIVIEANNEYIVTNNPGGHLVSDLYSGTEEVHYNLSTKQLIVTGLYSIRMSVGLFMSKMELEMWV